MAKYIMYINVEDSETLMTKEFQKQVNGFFDKTDAVLTVITNGPTRIEALQQELPKCSQKKTLETPQDS